MLWILKQPHFIRLNSSVKLRRFDAILRAAACNSTYLETISMLSQILLRITSTRFWNILLLYIFALILIIAIGAAILGVAKNLQPSSSTAPVSVSSLLIESAANTLGLGETDVSGQSQWIALLALSQGFVGILVNGLFVALVVFRAIRINHRALVFANHVLLSQQSDGGWRLEFRICNDSRFDIVNVVIRVQLLDVRSNFR